MTRIINLWVEERVLYVPPHKGPGCAPNVSSLRKRMKRSKLPKLTQPSIAEDAEVVKV